MSLVALQHDSVPYIRHQSPSLTNQRQELAAVARELAWHGDPERAQRAREALVQGGSQSIRPILEAVGRFPRADVQDEAASVLAKLAAREAAFSESIRLLGDLEITPPAFATLARALGSAELAPDAAQRAIQALSGLLRHQAAEVRDATVLALADRGGPDAKKVLEDALPNESSDFIREAIQDAIRDW